MYKYEYVVKYNIFVRKLRKKSNAWISGTLIQKKFIKNKGSITK